VKDNVTVSKLAMFYGEQEKWTRAMIKNHPSDEDAYWRHVDYIITQFDGLYAGYRAAALPQWVTRSLRMMMSFDASLLKDCDRLVIK